jgi:hypothetical protein
MPSTDYFAAIGVCADGKAAMAITNKQHGNKALT